MIIKILIIIAAVVLLLMLLYILSLSAASNRHELMKPYEDVFIAHRGLFNNSENIPENSLPAFSRAVEAGYGIELDVQTTTDGRLVVFHDEDMSRMCGVKKNLHQCSYDELMQYELLSSGERIPLFEDVLRVIGGKVPVIVEIKTEGDWRRTTRLAAEMLDKYEGLYCVESFNPLIVGWFRKNRPAVVRGQLSTNYFDDTIECSWIGKVLLTNLMFNFISRPDFVAYNHRWVDIFSYRLCRKLYHVKNAAWTIRNHEDLKKAQETFSIIIFDSFIP